MATNWGCMADGGLTRRVHGFGDFCKPSHAAEEFRQGHVPEWIGSRRIQNRTKLTEPGITDQRSLFSDQHTLFLDAHPGQTITACNNSSSD